MSLTENKTVQQFKCPNCGAPISFGADTQTMACEYCDCQLDIKALEEMNGITEESQSAIEWNHYDEGNGLKDWNESEKEDVKKYNCQSCGGSILTDSVTVATKCPYCDNPVVVPSEMAGEYRPDFVLPFSVSKNDAIEAFRNYLENKKLLPDLFKDNNHLEEVTGIYVPFWLFNSKTIGNIVYNGTKSRSWRSGDFRYTKKDYYMVKRSGSATFINVPADGSSKMDDTLMESIEPFDFSKGVEFTTAYLSGYLAQNYDVKSEELTDRVSQRMSNSILDMCNSTVQGYSSKTVQHKNILNVKGEINYALLPVWILNTKYNDTLYTFAMNGQTGKFVGKLPIDKNKAVAYFLKVFSGSFVVMSVIFTIIQMFM